MTVDINHIQTDECDVSTLTGNIISLGPNITISAEMAMITRAEYEKWKGDSDVLRAMVEFKIIDDTHIEAAKSLSREILK